MAAEKAGYKPTPAFRTTVSELRNHPEVVAELARLQATTERQAVLDRAQWLREWIQDVRFDPARFIRGDGTIDIEAAKECGLLSRTSAIKVVETTTAEGDVTRRVELKFPDRHSALTNIGRAEEFYAPEKHEVKHQYDAAGAVADLTEEEAAQLREEILALGLTEPAIAAEQPGPAKPEPEPKEKPKPKPKRRRKPRAAGAVAAGGGDTAAGTGSPDPGGGGAAEEGRAATRPAPRRL